MDVSQNFNKKLVIICILFNSLFNAACFSQFSYVPDFKESDIIPWSEKRLLKWPDFQGEMDSLSRIKVPYAKAGVFSYIEIKPEINDNSIVYIIRANFIKSISWKRDFASKSVSVSEHLLQHEQIHFDITEIYARKLRKAIIELDDVDEDVIRVLVENLFNELRETQNRYDSETSHSLIEDAQKEWYLKVQHDLTKLNRYAERRIVKEF